MNLSKRNLFIYSGVAAVVIFFILLLIILPQWQSTAYRAKFTDGEIQKLTPQEKIQYERNVADIEDKTRLTLAQIIGGLALLSGLYFTYQNVKTAQENLRVTEEGKLTERFSNAVELLGSEKLDVRLGGIYALERIARDSQKDHWTVIEVLTAFVRENSLYNREEKEDSAEYTRPKLRQDIQAIMTVIGRRKWTETETQRLNLLGTDLGGCDLEDANLSRARLSRANLIGVYWKHVDLNEVTWYETNLDRAYLRLALNLTLNQLLVAENFEKARLPYQLEAELKEWQAKQAKENAVAGSDSSENQSK